MSSLTVIRNPLDSVSYEKFEVKADVCPVLFEAFDGALPNNTRIYHNDISQSTDVTPFDRNSIEYLQSLRGDFYAVVYPSGLDQIITAVVLFALNLLVSVIFAPSVPAARKNRQYRSPNNAFASRTNEVRLAARIPDIFGTVWSTPDMLMFPYTFYEQNREVELSYMCVGRGHYDITKVLDGDTEFDNISLAVAEVYAPNTSPNSGHAPQLRIGDSAIGKRIELVSRSNSVNGQILRAPNEDYVRGGSNISFVYPDVIHSYSTEIDLTEKFNEGDTLVVSAAETQVLSSAEPSAPLVDVDFAGSYTILSVTSNEIVLVNPSAVNSDWIILQYQEETEQISPLLQTNSDKWTDWVELKDATATKMYVNVVAVNGMYKDDGHNQAKTTVDFTLQVQPINDVGETTGAIEEFTGTVVGSSTDHQVKAKTIFAELPFTGMFRMRARRDTLKDIYYAGAVVDEIQLRDVYSVSPVSETAFGGVTTIMVKNVATASALAVKDRKIRCLVTRKLPVWQENTFLPVRYATNKAADILCAVCVDPYIGNRSYSEIDFEGIHATLDELTEYFGTTDATEFCYTFDSELSFEETVSIICNAVFCIAKRQGSLISIQSEMLNSDSVILFNHRNKVPSTEEIRAVEFGFKNSNDGVELEWVDPDDDDAISTYYIPADRSALKPYTVEAHGVRNRRQAHFLAWRAYQKLKYQNTTVEFQATHEANLLASSDRILVADNTRPDTQDGEIVAQNGLSLTTSQPVQMTEGAEYSVFLQLQDGTVESIPCTSAGEYNITLAYAPRLPLVVSELAYARTTYCLSSNAYERASAAFLINTVTPKGDYTSTVNCGNYDERFYSHDSDYVNGLI